MPLVCERWSWCVGHRDPAGGPAHAQDVAVTSLLTTEGSTKRACSWGDGRSEKHIKCRSHQLGDWEQLHPRDPIVRTPLRPKAGDALLAMQMEPHCWVLWCVQDNSRLHHHSHLSAPLTQGQLQTKGLERRKHLVSKKVVMADMAHPWCPRGCHAL